MSELVTAPVAPGQLDWRQPQKVKYAIETWLRDEQIKLALSKVRGRIQPGEREVNRRNEPIAIVGYGPSLQDTWEQLRDFQHIVTCSGSHKFLLERGIVPNWHVEVDPRSHKIPLLGPPNPAVTYLVASTCHPKYFDHLEQGLGQEVFERQVLLWHVFDATNDGIRLLPHGEWAVTGGCDVGLRAMTLAAFLGFRDLHIFGLDGSARGEQRHAAEHPNGKQKYCEVHYPDENGETFYSTPAMLEASRQTFHELRQMPMVRATFYGHGLTQAMAQDFKPMAGDKNTASANVVGFVKPELISTTYRTLNEKLHRTQLGYGVGGKRFADMVLKLVKTLNTTSVLDYGCGKGYLAKSLPFPIWEYDPAIEGKKESPRPADIVICTDVLEHIEPEHLLAVLHDLRRVTLKVAYLVISTRAAVKVLEDGRNAHLIQKKAKWWKEQLYKVFDIGKVIEHADEVHFVCAPKAKKLPKPKTPLAIMATQS